MSFCWSPSMRGFYRSDIHGDAMPQDCIPVSNAEYEELMRRQNQGYAIVMRDGRPFAAPPQQPQETAQTVIPALEFRRSFTAAEKARITLAASSALEAGDATLQVFMDDTASAQTVHLRSPEVVAGIEYLVSKNLLTPRRADEILRR